MARFPDDMLRRLELLGRFQLDPPGSGINGDATTPSVLPFLDYARADGAEQAAFLGELHALVAADRGGFATYGATALTWELFGEKALRMPAAWPVLDAGIRFKLARGLPPGLILTGYELQRLGEWPDQRRDPAG